MTATTNDERRRLERLSRPELERWQLERLNALLADVLPANRFYTAKLAAAPRPLTSLAQLSALPYTLKEELISGEGHGRAENLTFPVERYTRLHRTSGTHGRPVVVLDTEDDWQWWLDGWQYVLDVADVTAADRALLAFSFGPFVGFWSAFEASLARGCQMIPAGGMTTLARLELIEASGATLLFCTPSYALHLAEVAAERKIELADYPIRAIFVAGEPGGSVPSVRQRLERAWNARVIDHGGASEVGPWGFGDAQGTGLHVLESQFLAEFRALETGHPAHEGELSELVLTTLGRRGAPVIRYRTGDLVRPVWQHDRECRFVLLDGGVLGRVDDMLIIRGVNIFPSSIEQIVHSFPEVVEFRMIARRRQAMDELEIEVEDRLDQPQRIAEELRLRLGLAIAVRCVALGSLPRFEGKASRLIDERTSRATP